MSAALTKDKKRIHSHEISVHLAWRSTLYVTNFPELADDRFMRDLFGKVSCCYECTKSILTTTKRYSPISMETSSTFDGRVKSSKLHAGSVISSLLLQLS